MTLTTLRPDALTRDAGGLALRLALPWIRALPLASLVDVAVSIDGDDIDDLRVPEPGDRWWASQDRVVIRGDRALASGPHDVTVDFGLVIPYLPGGFDGPLRLPFHEQRTLRVDAAAQATVSRDIA